MTKFIVLAAGLAVAASTHATLANGVVLNSVDPAAGFTSVDREYPGMDDRYVRYGVDRNHRQLQKLAAGQSKQQLVAVLGEPISADQTGAWHYEVNLPLTKDDDLVCQLKVSFDENELVNGTIWRRQQCADIAVAKARP